MARSAEAIEKRAMKRNRTEEDQRRADAKGMQKQLENVMALAKRQKLSVSEPMFNERDGKKEEANAKMEGLQATVSPIVKPCDVSNPLDEPGAWKCPGCDNYNFASRSVCHSKTCEEKRPAGTFVPPRAKKARVRHDEATSKKQVWVKQAGQQTMAQNQELRKRYLETGGEGMDEADVNRAKTLYERDERKKKKKETKVKSKSKLAPQSMDEGAPQSSSNKKNTVNDSIGTEQSGPQKRAKNQHLRKRYLETGGVGMAEEDVNRARILIERDERKKKNERNNNTGRLKIKQARRGAHTEAGREKQGW
jgi:hypothetical protein